MAGFLEPSPNLCSMSNGALVPPRGRLEEPDHSSTNWYFTREEIEEGSPSRKDGIDLKKETYFRKSYCTFLQDLGMRLKVPQVTIATAIVFCHRFFLCQSHAKNDRYTVATACMFLAGKVEETPQSLKNVILTSYEIRNKKDPAALQRIKQKEVYEQQKELVVLSERVVLATLGFDLNVHHPYKPLVAAIKKFKVAQNALAQVAWNFVNDGLRTSLCLQFKPHHIAAGAIFLAAKFLKVKLPSDREVTWWQEFDVTPSQLEDVSNQMLELYEQNKPNSTRGNEVGGSSVKSSQNMALQSAATSNGASHVPANSSPETLQPTVGVGTSRSAIKESPHTNKAQVKNANPQENTGHNVEGSIATKRKFAEVIGKHGQVNNLQSTNPVSSNRRSDKMEFGLTDFQKPTRPGNENKDKYDVDDPNGQKSWGGLDDLNKDKVKAALEKRRKSRGEGVDVRQLKPKDLVDEDDLIERELEKGVEAAAQAEKAKQDRRDGWAKSLYREEQEDGELRRELTDDNGYGRKRKGSSFDGSLDKRSRSDEMSSGGGWERNHPNNSYEHTEEGELPEFTPHDQIHTPRSGDKESSSPSSNRFEKGQRDYGVHEQIGSRENPHESKHRHKNHPHHYSSHYRQQYRADTERDRYYKDRDKQERDYKKSRHEHGKWD